MILQHVHWHRHGDRLHIHDHDFDTLLPEGADRYLEGGKPVAYYPDHTFNHQHAEEKEPVTA